MDPWSGQWARAIVKYLDATPLPPARNFFIRVTGMESFLFVVSGAFHGPFNDPMRIARGNPDNKRSPFSARAELRDTPGLGAEWCVRGGIRVTVR